MMKGYNREEAMLFIASRIHGKDHPELQHLLPEIIGDIIDADMAYMVESGVLDEEGNVGGEYYEDDDAFEYMVEKVAEEKKLTPEQAVKMASLIDDYMDFQQEYLESKGLVRWT
mgnify:CR=1 FL=1